MTSQLGWRRPPYIDLQPFCSSVWTGATTRRRLSTDQELNHETSILP